MASYKGHTVKAGVNWTVDKDTITITCYPSKGGYGYKLSTHTWKNQCPFKSCGAKGKLDGHGTKKSIGKWGVEGQIYCKSCGADFCGVSGKDLATTVRTTLKKASKKSSTTVTSQTSTNNKKTDLNKITNDYKEKSKPKKDFKLTIPPLSGIKEGSYIELRPPLVEKTQVFFIGSVDDSKEDMQLVLYEEVPEPGSEYKAPNETKTTTTNKNNNTPTTSVNVSGAKSSIEKTMMLKGAELKTIGKIFNWLRFDGGDGKFDYVYYYNWANGAGDPFVFNPSIAEKRWKMKSGNCVFFAWAFYMMCKGAGIKVKVVRGIGTFRSGSYGHFWNTYNGKVYDCSRNTCKNYSPTRVAI